METEIVRLAVELLVGIVIAMLGFFVRDMAKKLDAVMLAVHLLEVKMGSEFVTKHELHLVNEHLVHVTEDLSDVKTRVSVICAKLDVKGRV